MINLRRSLPASAFLLLSITGPTPAQAQQGDRPGHVMKPPPAEWKIPPAPVIPADKAIDTFKLADGFHLELVASEPDIHDPVAIAFDSNGRLWVAQMISFMPDIDGKGEGQPLGKITILEDSDGDGKVDKSKVFLDKIILPRALALADADHTLLYSDDSTLYAIEIKDDDQAGKQEVIDPAYAVGKNVEHKANGLLYGLDNWYYSAGTNKKFRKKNGKWVTEKTEKRGQWGITQDDYGHLATNTNSNFISVELYPPNLTIRNPNHSFKTATTARLKKQSTWPSRITPGINRGYLDGFLTKEGYLASPTAACGSVIYRGDNFPKKFYNNLFLPEPAGNLMKRALISEQDGIPSISQAYDKKEFLTSSDERSRIVNAYTAPDGTLYIVDFYRGILQHGAFLTTYLRNEILSRELDKPVGLGRIYRVVSEDKKPGPQPKLKQLSSSELVKQLSHANGWWRETAQRLLVQRRDPSAAPALRALLDPDKNSNPLAATHAIWALAGLNQLTPADLKIALQREAGTVRAQAIRAAELFAKEPQSDTILDLFAIHLGDSHPEVQAQLAASLALFHHSPAKQTKSFASLIQLLNKSEIKQDRLHDLILSGLFYAELDFLNSLINSNNQNSISENLIAAIIKSGNQKNIDRLIQTVTSKALNSKTRLALIEQLAASIMVSQKSPLIRKLFTQAADLPVDERLALGSGLLRGKKSIKGRFRPLRIGKQKPTLLTDTSLLPFEQQKRLNTLFDFSDGKKVTFLKTAADKKQYALGKTHYEKVCFACHQANGTGTAFLAPPLVNSEWVVESPDRLIALVMDGMTGPVTVNGRTYTTPQVQPLMPGLRNNPELTDEQIAAILTYIRNSWSNGASPIATKSISDYRQQQKARLPFTEAELKKIK